MASLNGGASPSEQGGVNRQNLQPGGVRGQASHASLKAAFHTDFRKIFGSGNAQKKTTRDGQPPKKRGPKPDTKPAMTRRQELNRQAQRTHRERKEQYIRSLETEVSRLREAYTQEMAAANISLQQHREVVQSLRDENEILKEMLLSHGIQYEAELDRRKAERLAAYHQHSPLAASSTASGSQVGGLAHSTSYIQSTTPATTVASGLSPRTNGTDQIEVSPPLEQQSTQTNMYGGHHHHLGSPELPMALDRAGGPVSLGQLANRPVPAVQGVFESDPQLQIDFILTLEGPCREHTDYLCRRSVTEADDEDMPFSGHALMATCPPPTYISSTTAAQPYPHQTVDLPHANLATLLNLSRQLVTEGQITPIMALQFLKNHDLYPEMTREDIKAIIDTLNTKVRCYGFGACVEDFELMDCLTGVLGRRFDGAGGGEDVVVQRVDDDMTY